MQRIYLVKRFIQTNYRLFGGALYRRMDGLKPLRTLLRFLSFRFVGDDVNVNLRRFPQKSVRCGKIEILFPTLCNRSAEDDLRNMLFANGMCDRVGNTDALQLQDHRPEIFRESEIRGDGAPFFVAVVASGFDVNYVEFGIEAASHAGGTRDEILRGGI